MLYWDHGIHRAFSGNYDEYFSTATNVDACVYLMLANQLVHDLVPEVKLGRAALPPAGTVCQSIIHWYHGSLLLPHAGQPTVRAHLCSA